MKGGAQACGRPIGEISKGKRADFVVLDSAHPNLIDRSKDNLIDSMIFSGNTPKFQEVWIGGKRQVANGRHVREQDTLDTYSNVIRGLDF